MINISNWTLKAVLRLHLKDILSVHRTEIEHIIHCMYMPCKIRSDISDDVVFILEAYYCFFWHPNPNGTHPNSGLRRYWKTLPPDWQTIRTWRLQMIGDIFHTKKVQTWKYKFFFVRMFNPKPGIWWRLRDVEPSLRVLSRTPFAPSRPAFITGSFSLQINYVHSVGG